MRIETIITDAVTLTERTGIPVIFFSNPGFGKTTILKRYADSKGYHLETLIGSRFSPEEISGYQVNNGGDHLTHMSPEWYSRVMKKSREGVRTLLFIDEISTCSEAVQGALLSLIFDRTIGSEKFLPEDCIIISAANYSQNLPPAMNIMAPTLNRFILINLNDGYKAMDMIDEFISEEDEQSEQEDYRHAIQSAPLTPLTPQKQTPKQLTPQERAVFTKNFKTIWQEIFLKYADKDGSHGFLDISNRNLDGLYSDNDDYIFNFISGRTLSYLYRSLIAYMEIGLDNEELLNKITDGLVGNGTGTFTDGIQGKKFRNFVEKQMSKLLITRQQQFSAPVVLVHDIVKDVQNYLINSENLLCSNEERIEQASQILEDIKNTINIRNVIQQLAFPKEEPQKVAQFTAQMEALIDLQKHASFYLEAPFITDELTKIAMDFYGLYCDVVNIKPDFESTFGCSNKLFDRIVFLEKLDSHGNKVYARAALRKPVRGEYPSLNILKKDESLISAKLNNIVHDSDGLRVVYWKDGIKTMASEIFVRSMCKKAA